MSQINVYTEPGPRPEGAQLRIYTNPVSFYGQRVVLCANAKGVSIDIINVNLSSKEKPDWFVEKINPHGKVPVIEHEGNIIRESLIAFDYIDEVFGGGSLWPSEPHLKAKARLLVNDFEATFFPNLVKFYGNPSDESAFKEVLGFFEYLEASLTIQSDQTAYLYGPGVKPGAPDYLIWPMLERLCLLKAISPAFAEVFTEAKFPWLLEYIANMMEDEAVKRCYLPPKVHLGFMKKQAETGEQDYSIADETGTGIVIYSKKEE